MNWGLVGPVPTQEPAYSELEAALLSQIRGKRGCSESDSFHGDGMDWLEVDLEPSLAMELRQALGRADQIERVQGAQTFGAAPVWWPTNWPSDVRFYRLGLRYLAIPESGRQAWFLQVRT
jgi:hypothetical protein